jgi:hypothetical protein
MGKKCKKLRETFCKDKKEKNEKDKKDDNEKKEKKEKTNKKVKSLSKKLKDNNIRKICQYLGSFVKDSIIGSYYYYIHLFIMTMCGLTIFFSKNIHYLTILLIIVTLDLILMVILHDCPITMYEQKYLGTSGIADKNKFLKNLGISHQCDHYYEVQLETVINIWSVIVSKISTLIIFKLLRFDIV